MFPRLIAVRLSSTRFAYLSLIRRTLFKHIQLVPKLEKVKRLAGADFYQIAPFVTMVSFVVPFDNWIFRKKAEFLAEERRTRELSLEASSAGSSNDDALADHHDRLDNDQDLKAPIGRSPRASGTYRYDDSRRLAVRDLLLGVFLKAAWSSALKAMPHVRTVHFKTRGFEDLIKDKEFEFYRILPRNTIIPERYQDSCRKTAAPLGDALFAVATFCLAKANVEVRVLKVACVLSEKFGWETLPGWDDLNLSHMEVFKFWPLVRVRVAPPVEEAAPAVAAVLRKCGDNLDKLSYKAWCPMSWPGGEFTQLPNLTWLSIGWGPIRPRYLSVWMSEMPYLGIIQLHCTMLDDLHDPYSWREVLDAIRAHPNKAIYVSFWETARLRNLEYATDKFEEFLAMKASGTPDEDCEWSLPLYLSGKIEWNESLEKLVRDD